MPTNTILRDSILKDLENIYEMALAKENFTVALKAKELLGREHGLFLQKNSSSTKGGVSLKDLSEDDLTRLISEIEEQLALDPREGKE